MPTSQLDTPRPETVPSRCGRPASAGTYRPAREVSTAGLFGQVMFLVAIAIAFLAGGVFIGKDLPDDAALACVFGGIGMLLIADFGGERLREGSVAIAWLFAASLLLGLGLAPTLALYASAEATALTHAVAGTALTVMICGAVGILVAKDLASWMRPICLILLAVVAAAWVFVLFTSTLNPIFSILIYGFSALSIIIDFNYVRRNATESDVVWLATGIFLSILNIFLSLLDLFSE